jgi:hypothetical protein
MKSLFSATLLFFALCAGQSALAGTVSIRIVEASAKGKTNIDDSLADVRGVLEGTFHYKVCKQVSSKSVSLPSKNETVKLPEGYVLNLDGAESSLKLTISLKGETKVDSTVTLAKGKPLIVGGYSKADGSAKILVILTAE